MNNRIHIVFEHFTARKFFIKQHITRCINAVLAAEGVHIPCEINVLITDDAGIRVINNSARNIDKATDVLSFPMFELTAGQYPDNWDEYLDPESGMCPLGDMCISLERAEEQAKEYGHSPKREIGYLTIHSVLHLLGYDHLDEGEQKKKMRSREEAIASEIPGMRRE